MQEVYRPVTVIGYPARAPYCHSNGATACPYVAPPPYSQSQYPDLERNRPTKYSPQCFIIPIVIILVFGIFALVAIWTIKMQPAFPDFELDSLSLTNFSTDSRSLTGTWSIGFLVRNNDERWNVTYDVLRFSLVYKDSFISGTNLAPFTQGTNSENTWNAKLYVINAYVEPDDISGLLEGRSHGSIRFDFEISSRGCWFRSYDCYMWFRVLYHDVRVGISSNSSEGKLTGGARQCRVESY